LCPLYTPPVDIIAACGIIQSGGKGVYSVKEASEKLGISDRRTRQLLSQGRLEGKKLGRDWVVLSLDYQRRRAARGKRGKVTWEELRAERHL
jgi:excisionase family DNA binding protein